MLEIVGKLNPNICFGKAQALDLEVTKRTGTQFEIADDCKYFLLAPRKSDDDRVTH